MAAQQLTHVRWLGDSSVVVGRQDSSFSGGYLEKGQTIAVEEGLGAILLANDKHWEKSDEAAFKKSQAEAAKRKAEAETKGNLRGLRR